MNNQFTVRRADPSEFQSIGQMMVEVYTELEGFPNADEQPKYYHLLANIGDFTLQPHTELLVAVNEQGDIGGAVVFLSDLANYGASGLTIRDQQTSAFRLLTVGLQSRGMGIGRLLTEACIDKAKKLGHEQMIIHTTDVMQVAWKMYEKYGFRRSEDLDFLQESLPILGFRLSLVPDN